MPAVETHDLTKRYGDYLALDHCSLRVQPGEVFGLLGPNGAGKTTLLRTLLGYLTPTAGSATIDGHDIAKDSLKVRQKVAYLPGDARLPRHMRGISVLRFFGDLHPEGSVERSIALAERMELELRRRVGFMSTGMRQKLALSIVLGTNAPILILDEPTTNLDPTIRRTVLAEVCQARDAGRTVIFSSHVLSEIEQVCDRVIFLRQGKLVREQAIAPLLRKHRIVLWLDDPKLEIPETLRDHVSASTDHEGRVILETDGDLPPLLQWLGTLEPHEMRLEPLGISSLYDRIHHATPETRP